MYDNVSGCVGTHTYMYMKCGDSLIYTQHLIISCFAKHLRLNKHAKVVT